MSTSSSTRRVFISHSRQDNELVRDIARRLRAVGFEPFADFGEFASGAEFKKHLRERLTQCSVFLVLVTPASQRSRYRRRQQPGPARTAQNSTDHSIRASGSGDPRAIRSVR